MKTNLNKLKDGLFASFVLVMVALVIAVIAIGVNKADDNYSSTVMVSGDNVTFKNPLDNCEVIKDFSAEKLQFNSTLKQWEAHKAIDLKANVGDSVYAIASGKVTKIDTTHLWGTVIVVKHDNGFESCYSSLSKDVKVSVGDKVTRGQKLGAVENSAKCECEQDVHLHFELIKDGKKIDPNLYFAFGQK